MRDEGPVPQGTGPFPIEPLGLLHGVDARAAVTAGVARWLAGGNVAFTLFRRGGAVFPAGVLGEGELLTAAVGDWAGLGTGPLVMGILNVTPDSFSDGGDHLDAGRAVEAGLGMMAAGADILDVGGESTRPGAGAISEAEEQARVIPVLTALAREGAVVSIDTRNAGTMALALDAGARIVNDVTALRWDARALPLVAARGCPVVLMHMRGTPATMKGLAVYGDVALEVFGELGARVAEAVAVGVRPGDIAVDPGFGFAKDAGQNLELLQRMGVLAGLGCAVLAGISRKATIGMLSGEADARRRGPGSMAAALYALTRGARVLRVHDVAETVQAVRVWRGVAG